MQRTLTGCAFCDASFEQAAGEARTWGASDLVTHPICVECATQTRSDPAAPGQYACDGCGLVVNVLAALTRFRVEIGHLKGTLRICRQCAPSGAATYWTRDLDAHCVTNGNEETDLVTEGEPM